MAYICGGSETKVEKINKAGRPLRKKTFSVQNRSAGKYNTVNVHSAYLGRVPLECYDHGNGWITLVTMVPGLPGTGGVIVKEVDAAANGLDMNRMQYVLSRLDRLPITTVNLKRCAENAATLAFLRAKESSNKPLTQVDKAARRAALVYNNAVDIHFLTCQYIRFLQERLGINNVINTNLLLSCHNCPRMDNAFFTGEYMVYGNGDTEFLPLGTADICGHELGHGLVQSFAGLEYQGHAGALNESFADVMGVCFEFWLYEKFNVDADVGKNLAGVSDWVMGEDCGQGAVKFLRNIEDPTNAPYPQPKTYRGQYWADPNGSADYGGVHQNSGVGNYCFYQFSTATDKKHALDVFLAALKTLKPLSSYMEYRDALKVAGGADAAKPLALAGLTDTAVSDWIPKRTGIVDLTDDDASAEQTVQTKKRVKCE